ncbi:MAG: hypothetical protein AAB415_00970, partial [Patescibacteria group bacterium]
VEQLPLKQTVGGANPSGRIMNSANLIKDYNLTKYHNNLSIEDFPDGKPKKIAFRYYLFFSS